MTAHARRKLMDPGIGNFTKLLKPYRVGNKNEIRKGKQSKSNIGGGKQLHSALLECPGSGGYTERNRPVLL